MINFYPRSPCGERHRYGRPIDVQLVFLSTLSLRRATCPLFFSCWVLAYFYPRSPCGERRGYLDTRQHDAISIHALLAESDARRDSRQHPAGISIHALLAESDEFRKLLYPGSTNFYPRSPCGERPTLTITICTASKFLSTLSLRRATNKARFMQTALEHFYPRSPCGERRAVRWRCRRVKGFLSTLSLRRATRPDP